MKLRIQDGLPLVSATITHNGSSIDLRNVVVDTGSVGSVFPADRLAQISVIYARDDQVRRVQGVGGAEFVFTKRVDEVTVVDVGTSDLEIEIGSLDYGFDIDGILGMNWLRAVGAVIDLAQLEIRTGT